MQFGQHPCMSGALIYLKTCNHLRDKQNPTAWYMRVKRVSFWSKVPAAAEITCIRCRARRVSVYHNTAPFLDAFTPVILVVWYTSSLALMCSSSWSSCAASLSCCFSPGLRYFCFAIFVTYDSAVAPMLHWVFHDSSHIVWIHVLRQHVHQHDRLVYHCLSIGFRRAIRPWVHQVLRCFRRTIVSHSSCLRPVRYIDSLLPSTFPRLLPLTWSSSDFQSVSHICRVMSHDLVFRSSDALILSYGGCPSG